MALALGACREAPDEMPAPQPVLAADRPPFDGRAAMALVDTQVAFGPRVPGRAGHAAQLAWMLDELTPLADTVVADTFDYTHSDTGERLQLTNVLARFRPEAPQRLLFLTHWDTRPTSDAASEPEERALPVPGANDGASGTAILLEVARILASQDLPVGVDLLFVDGEDYGPTVNDMFMGSEHFAANLPDGYDPRYGVLLDMVGDAEPRFPIEGNSAERAPDVAQRVWSVAARLGYGQAFPMQVGIALSDDHLPLNDAGIPTIDVIDFDYGPGNAYWHTPDDTPDQVRPATLDMVGEVVLELIFMGG